MNEAGVLPITAGCVVLSAPAVLRPPPTPSRLGATSRLSGYTHRLLPGRSARGRGGPPQFPPPPSARSAPLTPGGSSTVHARLFPSSMAFALLLRARLLLGPFRVSLTTRQASLDAADRTVAPTKVAFDAALRRRAFPPDAGSLLPGLLAATRTGLAPAGGGELAGTLDHATSLTSSRTDRARPLGTQYADQPRRTRLRLVTTISIDRPT
jgi:hypothetical protein